MKCSRCIHVVFVNLCCKITRERNSVQPQNAEVTGWSAGLRLATIAGFARASCPPQRTCSASMLAYCCMQRAALSQTAGCTPPVGSSSTIPVAWALACLIVANGRVIYLDAAVVHIISAATYLPCKQHCDAASSTALDDSLANLVFDAALSAEPLRRSQAA